MSVDRRLAVLIATVCLFWSAAFHHTRDWNSASRFLLTHAIVQNRSFEVTPFVAVDGMLVRNPPTKDLASPDRQRYFCDKPPGQSIVGAAFLAAFRPLGLFEDHPVAADVEASRPEQLSLRRSDRWLTIATSGLAGATAVALLYLLLRRWMVKRSIAAISALALEFASPWQVYASLYYSHALAGCFVLACVFLLDHGPRTPKQGFGAAFLAGVFAGFAVVAEYSLATFVVVLCLVGVSHGVSASLARRRNEEAKTAVCFLLGGLGPALFLAWYHWCVTGDPFVPPYRYEIEPMFAAIHAKGGGIPLSSLQPGALWRLLFGLSIGLFCLAPGALWSVVGVASLIRRRRLIGWTILFSVASLVLVIACFPNWNGGLATGPRMLVPALPLLFLASGWAWDRASTTTLARLLRAAAVPFVVASAILVTAMNASGGRKPFEISVADFIIQSQKEPQREKHLGDWILSFFGVPSDPAASFAVLLLVETCCVGVVMRYARDQEV